MHALELLLDPTADDAVRREWALLQEAGLPSQADHRGESNAPHITVLATDEQPSGIAAVSTLAAGALPLRVRLGSLVVFPGRRLVLARLVIVDEGLLGLHRAVLGAAGAAPSSLTTTQGWVPHVTLARGIPADGLSAARSVIEDQPIDAVATTLHHWDSQARTATTLGG